METRRGHEIPLELEFQAVVSHPVWFLAKELCTSARPVSTLMTELPLQFPPGLLFHVHTEKDYVIGILNSDFLFYMIL